jgi:hypothetical protein
VALALEQVTPNELLGSVWNEGYKMIEAATIAFRDTHSGDDAVVILRYDYVSVTLSVSLKSEAMSKSE